jgi:hypothetical protein
VFSTGLRQSAWCVCQGRPAAGSLRGSVEVLLKRLASQRVPKCRGCIRLSVHNFALPQTCRAVGGIRRCLGQPPPLLILGVRRHGDGGCNLTCGTVLVFHTASATALGTHDQNLIKSKVPLYVLPSRNVFGLAFRCLLRFLDCCIVRILAGEALGRYTRHSDSKPQTSPGLGIRHPNDIAIPCRGSVAGRLGGPHLPSGGRYVMSGKLPCPVVHCLD